MIQTYWLNLHFHQNNYHALTRSFMFVNLWYQHYTFILSNMLYSQRVFCYLYSKSMIMQLRTGWTSNLNLNQIQLSYLLTRNRLQFWKKDKTSSTSSKIPWLKMNKLWRSIEPDGLVEIIPLVEHTWVQSNRNECYWYIKSNS